MSIEKILGYVVSCGADEWGKPYFVVSPNSNAEYPHYTTAWTASHLFTDIRDADYEAQRWLNNKRSAANVGTGGNIYAIREYQKTNRKRDKHPMSNEEIQKAKRGL